MYECSNDVSCTILKGFIHIHILFFQLEENEPHVDYGFCWDNVQLLQETKHCSTEHANRFLLMAMTFAVRNHESFTHLRVDDVIAAVDVDPMEILPSYEVTKRVKGRMIHLVSKMMVNHVPWLQHLQKLIQQHIPHRYTEEMRQKSEILRTIIAQNSPP